MQRVVKIKHGDTIVETIFAVAIFAALSVMAIHTMNNGLMQSQRALETTMARNMIDSQAEALRFVHNSYVAEREYSSGQQQFSDIWKKITEDDMVVDGKDIVSDDANAAKNFDVNQYGQCSEAYDSHMAQKYVINPRFVIPQDVRKKSLDNVIVQNSKLVPASTHPRIIYKDKADGSISESNTDTGQLKEASGLYYADRAEGVWVITAKGDVMNKIAAHSAEVPQYYDFYISTCWQSSASQAPSTLNTVVRLYNPELIE